MTRQAYENLRAGLLAHGYTFIHNEIDQEIAAETNCPHCGTVYGYEGLRDPLRPAHYRSFLVCQTCGNVEEF